jgi:hypothetical protein
MPCDERLIAISIKPVANVEPSERLALLDQQNNQNWSLLQWDFWGRSQEDGAIKDFASYEGN